MTIPRTSRDTTRQLDDSRVKLLRERLRGALLQPEDPGYDAARAVYNAGVERYPALIVQCMTVADIAAGVNFAREHELLLAIRGGGHSVSGLGTCDGGIVLDLSRMHGVDVDPREKTARIEGGATWSQVDHATHAYGLATPGGVVSTTGVAGLTLGGGFGHLSRHYGLSCDNLLSADIITADGQLRTVSDWQEPDLFWAIRGGGGNFGVVTSFTFQLHPVDMIVGGPLFYSPEQAADVLRGYREYMRQAPDEMSAFFGFHLIPPAPFIPAEMHFKPSAVIVVCYSGRDLQRGEHIVEQLRGLGTVIVEHVGPMPYPALNSAFDAIVPPGLHHYWKADYVSTLTDAAIDVHATYGPKVPSVQSAMHLYPQTGAIQRIGKSDSAYWHRDVEYIHNIVAADTDPGRTGEHMVWMQGYYDALRSLSEAGGYVNFMTDDEGQERIKATYGANYDRLLRVKKIYDPDNLFRVNQNIWPSS
ncbi:MAG TPA: FAD-binding oxidoreductase [Thermomicrobiales bacterium]|nr:FAD-binding oxidoreductase [Thermomicrobiales bacterium]